MGEVNHPGPGDAAGRDDRAAGAGAGRRAEGLRRLQEHPHPAEERRHRRDRRSRSTTRTRSRASGQRRSTCSPATRWWCPTRADGTDDAHPHNVVDRRRTGAGRTLASAQQADPRLSEERQPVGWTVTPWLTTGVAYDDNVLVVGEGDGLPADLNTGATRAAASTTSASAGRSRPRMPARSQLYRDFRYAQQLRPVAQRVGAAPTVAARAAVRPAGVLEDGDHGTAGTVGHPLRACRRAHHRLARRDRGVAKQTAVDRRVIHRSSGLPSTRTRCSALSLLGGHAERRISRRAVPDHGTHDADGRLRPAARDVVDGNQFNVQNAGPAPSTGCPSTRTSTARSGSRGSTRPTRSAARPSPIGRAGYARQFESAGVRRGLRAFVCAVVRRRRNAVERRTDRRACTCRSAAGSTRRARLLAQ